MYENATKGVEICDAPRNVEGASTRSVSFTEIHRSTNFSSALKASSSSPDKSLLI